MIRFRTLLKLIGLCLLLASTHAVAQSAGTVTYVYTDPQGTPLAEADASGNITATFDYTPYGTTALGTPPNGLAYTGHVNDPETSLVYMQARYYDPVTGHFLSTDPIGPEAGNAYDFNRYSYVNNNPIMGIDPTGMDDQDCSYACMRMRQLANWFDGIGRGLLGGNGGSPTKPLGQMEATTSVIQGQINQDLATASGAAAIATDPAISVVPGGSLAICKSNGCNGLGWTLAAIGAIPGGEEEILGVDAIKGVVDAATGARDVAGPIYQTTKDAKQAAEALGFKKVNETVHGGQAVFRRGRDFITRDLDGHNGGAWKMADSVKALGSKETRAGTYDANLNRIGD